MDTLNALQCKEARMLLRWNVKDLSYHSNVDARRIQRFEAAEETLYGKEMTAIIEAFEKYNVRLIQWDSAEIHEGYNGYDTKISMTQQSGNHDEAAAVLARLLSATAS